MRLIKLNKLNIFFVVILLNPLCLKPQEKKDSVYEKMAEEYFVDKYYKAVDSSRRVSNIIQQNLILYKIYEVFEGKNERKEIIESIIDKLPPMSCFLKFKIKQTDILFFPDQNYKVYEIEYKYKSFDCLNKLYTRKVDYFHDTKYLIGISDKNILFISGNWFVDDISQFFIFNSNDSLALNNYIALKSYNLSLDSIKLYKKKKNKIIFRAYSKELNEIVYVTLWLKDYLISYECENCFHRPYQHFFLRNVYFDGRIR